MLVFNSLLKYPKGTLESILIEAYSSFHERYPEYREENLKNYNECDTFFYENPKIGESCSFVSEYEGKIAGMCCWDPRENPTVIIGHNCILPKLKGKGLGTASRNAMSCDQRRIMRIMTESLYYKGIK